MHTVALDIFNRIYDSFALTKNVILNPAAGCFLCHQNIRQSDSLYVIPMA